MAPRRAAKSATSGASAHVGKLRRVPGLQPRIDHAVQGGRVFTKHPAKVTAPDIKLS